jgi:hypothetical protein
MQSFAVVLLAFFGSSARGSKGSALFVVSITPSLYFGASPARWTPPLSFLAGEVSAGSLTVRVGPPTKSGPEGASCDTRGGNSSGRAVSISSPPHPPRPLEKARAIRKPSPRLPVCNNGPDLLRMCATQQNSCSAISGRSTGGRHQNPVCQTGPIKERARIDHPRISPAPESLNGNG